MVYLVPITSSATAVRPMSVTKNENMILFIYLRIIILWSRVQNVALRPIARGNNCDCHRLPHINMQY